MHVGTSAIATYPARLARICRTVVGHSDRRLFDGADPSQAQPILSSASTANDSFRGLAFPTTAEDYPGSSLRYEIAKPRETIHRRL
jgi:hypothetical protein